MLVDNSFLTMLSWFFSLHTFSIILLDSTLHSEHATAELSIKLNDGLKTHFDVGNAK